MVWDKKEHAQTSLEPLLVHSMLDVHSMLFKLKPTDRPRSSQWLKARSVQAFQDLLSRTTKIASMVMIIKHSRKVTKARNKTSCVL